MLKRTPGLHLDEKGDGFILRRITPSGRTMGMSLSAEDVLSLAQSAQALRIRALSRHDPEGGSVRAVYATPVVQIALQPETLGERILLTMVPPSATQLTFALPLHIVEYLVERLPDYLARAKATTPTKQ